MVDRYIDRPNRQYNHWLYGIVDNTWFVIFVANYCLDYENNDENYIHLDVLGEEIKETLQGISKTLPQSLLLMSSSEKLKLLKTRQFLMYHVSNKHLHPEKFAHYLLFIFYPFRDENVWKPFVHASW